MKYFLSCGTTAIVVTALVFTLSACGFSHHTGNANISVELVDSTIVKGKTNKTDLLTAFGPPQSTQKRSISQAEKNNPNTPVMLKAPETWMYWSSNMEGSAVFLPFVAQTSTKISTSTLAIYLDESGTVLDYSTTQSGN